MDPQPPQRFDLSGTWLLQADLSDAPPNPKGFESPPPVPTDGQRARRRVVPGSRGGLAFVAHDFPVLKAQRMTIEQNRDSMGIEYDRGRYRDVSWGMRTRGLWDVDAGWNDAGQLVLRWKASDARAREVMALSANGQQLTVMLQIKAGEQNVDVRRVFSRR
ncbi:MAG: hypothetical protein AB8B93_13860 [Pseudomonadales bacterium]